MRAGEAVMKASYRRNDRLVVYGTRLRSPGGHRLAKISDGREPAPRDLRREDKRRCRLILQPARSVIRLAQQSIDSSAQLYGWSSPCVAEGSARETGDQTGKAGPRRRSRKPLCPARRGPTHRSAEVNSWTRPPGCVHQNGQL